MSKVATSISMDADLAAELKNEATEIGKSFSAHVVDLIESSRAREKGLFAPTEEVERTVNYGHIKTPVEQAVSEAKEPLSTEQADPRSVPSSEGVRSAPPAERDLDDGWWPEQESINKLSFKEAVFACVVDTHKRTPQRIAEFLETDTDSVDKTLDELLTEGRLTGGPIHGIWHFWLLDDAA